MTIKTLLSQLVALRLGSTRIGQAADLAWGISPIVCPTSDFGTP